MPTTGRASLATLGFVCVIFAASTAAARKPKLEDCDPHPNRYWYQDAKGAAETIRYSQKGKECLERNAIRLRLQGAPDVLRRLEAIWADVFAESFDEDSELDRQFQGAAETTIRNAIEWSRKHSGELPVGRSHDDEATNSAESEPAPAAAPEASSGRQQWCAAYVQRNAVSIGTADSGFVSHAAVVMEECQEHKTRTSAWGVARGDDCMVYTGCESAALAFRVSYPTEAVKYLGFVKHPPRK